MTITHQKIFGLRVTGIQGLQKHIKQVSASIKRSRYIGIPRVGRYLFNKKRLDCKMGLYSGQEVAPNKWRYGWENLGGPAKNYFTKATLNAHRISGPKFGKTGDIVAVSLNSAKAPHAEMIHGPINSMSSYF